MIIMESKRGAKRIFIFIGLLLTLIAFSFVAFRGGAENSNSRKTKSSVNEVIASQARNKAKPMYPPSGGGVGGVNEVNTLDEIENPYSRPKHGPPLNNVTHKVNAKWLYNWLKNPKEHDPEVKMPNLKLDDDEIKSVIAYLTSIVEAQPPQVAWEPFLLKTEDEMTEEEWEEMDSLSSKGKTIWSQARCTICHTVEGPVGEPIGGFVTLQVGVDLSNVNGKVNQDWLYRWLKNPKEYFPESLMPRYRFSDEELRAFVEYIMRDSSFAPDEEEEVENEQKYAVSTEPAIVEEGKRVIELSRCVLCHDIKGIKEILPVDLKKAEPSGEFAKLLNDVRCLTCHSIKETGGDYAPDLNYAGSKLKKEWIVNFLQTPDMIRPLSQQMPKFNLTEEEAKIAAGYIKENLKRPEFPTNILTNPTDEPKAEGVGERSEQISKGEKIFYEKGCQACHTAGAKGGALGPELTAVSERLEPEYIFFHLKDPQQANRYAVEPNYGLSLEEAISLNSFLMTRRKPSQ